MVFNPKKRPCDKIQLNIDGALIDEEQHTINLPGKNI